MRLIFGKCPGSGWIFPDFFIGKLVQSLGKADVPQVIALTDFQGTSVKDRGGFIIAFGNSFAHLDVQITDTKDQDSEQGSR
jgi:hypothetical protein